jgi:hypothetical protein
MSLRTLSYSAFQNYGFSILKVVYIANIRPHWMRPKVIWILKDSELFTGSSNNPKWHHFATDLN